ncbi:MAG: SDR family oxidoreductase [Bacteroidales bacterium]|nr:SDR family oxidoreductase [Bacteroidales bacterium]
MLGIKDKTIIVTGGCGLIGREIVRELHEAGARVLNADLTLETDPDAGTFHLDLSDNASIDALVAFAKERFDRIDALINSAYPHTRDWSDYFFEDEPFEHFKRNVELQLDSVFYLDQQVAKVMMEQRGGAIVNFGSIYGIVGNNFTIYEEYGGTSTGAYCAIKGGIINFTRYLASYLGKWNIRVNCVSPGGVFDRNSPEQNEIFIRNYTRQCPMKRMAEPEDIAPVAIFLASDMARYVTGQNVAADGGWTCI